MRVLVTWRLPAEGLAELAKECQVEVNQLERVYTQEELKLALADKDAILGVFNRIDQEIIDAAPKLKIISNFGVGYDKIDIAYATKKGIVVTYLPDAVTESTAEMTWALLLALTRRIIEADQLARSSECFTWSPNLLLGNDLFGKRMGILGFGRIGQAVARRAIAFGMEVVYSGHRQTMEVEARLPATYLELEELLATADVISVHLPLSPATHHFIGQSQLELIKRSAVLVNMARGPIIDEVALINALQQGKLKGAALDVYEHEPEVPLALRELKNVVLAPHLGTATIETRIGMTRKAAQNILDFKRGLRPVDVVNPEVFKD